MTSNGPWMEFLYLLMTYVSGVLYYVSTTINPILYNIMSNKFRMAFMVSETALRNNRPIISANNVDARLDSLFQETLSRSCRLPGLPARHEQRSYSSLSRSQQRTIGAYNSKTEPGTGGRGSGRSVAADSTDGSGNSSHEAASQKQAPRDDPPESADARPSSNGHRKWRENGRANGKDRSVREHQDVTPWSRTSARYVRAVSNADDSDKKWWRLLKWLPGLKVLKFSGRPTVAEDRALDESASRREELSMTMWNIRDGNLPV